MTTAHPLTPDPVRDTYRYVRIILVGLTVMLVAATLIDARHHGWRPSISDYYAGPVRDVFVGCLMAIGACLIAFKGSSKLEDYALNFAGLNAFLVALVPNNFSTVLAAAREMEHQSVATADPDGTLVTTSASLLTNLRSLVLALFIASLIFVVVDALVMHWTRFDLHREPRLSVVLAVLTFALETALLIVAALMFFGRETLGPWSIFDVIHFGSAALLIGNLSFAIASYAWPGRLLGTARWGAPADAAHQRLYRILFTVMWIGLVVGVVFIVRKASYAILLTEYFAIGMFLAWWVIETKRSWMIAE